MKPTNFLAALAILCFAILAPRASAQVDLTASPLNFLWGDPNIGADFGLSDNFSIEANAGYSQGSLFGVGDRRRVPVNLIGKYYFSPRRGADGFYGDLFLRYTNRNLQLSPEIDSTLEDKSFSSNKLGLGFGLGYKVVSEKGFVFDVGAGLGRAIIVDRTANVDEEDYEVPDWVNLKIMGYAKVSIGYRFGHKQRE